MYILLFTAHINLHHTMETWTIEISDICIHPPNCFLQPFHGYWEKSLSVCSLFTSGCLDSSQLLHQNSKVNVINNDVSFTDHSNYKLGHFPSLLVLYIDTTTRSMFDIHTGLEMC